MTDLKKATSNQLSGVRYGALPLFLRKDGNNNGIYKQQDGGLHQAQPEPLRAANTHHRPHHASLRRRPVYSGRPRRLVLCQEKVQIKYNQFSSLGV